jgi:hypothetical protein
MINNLEQYVDKWDLKVNLNKSKIIVFRNGGKYSKNEKWWFKNNLIEVVNRYKYLGVILTPQLSLDPHLLERLTSAKFGINSFWRSFVMQNKVPFKAKLKLFNSVSRSILCYAAQVWGGRMYDRVEALQRFFIKKVFNLPSYAPTSMLLIETGLTHIFIHTIKLHLNYIHKALNMPQNRLPYILCQQTIKRKIFWMKDWETLNIKYNLHLSPVDIVNTNITSYIYKIQQSIISQTRKALFNNIQSQEHYTQYRTLSTDLGDNNYIYKIHNIKSVQYILKVRCELLFLNYNIFRTNNTQLCSMCNMGVVEDVYHFVGVCPILAEFRKAQFNIKHLTPEAFREVLNGSNWNKLINYCKHAYMYRSVLVSEFNL